MRGRRGDAPLDLLVTIMVSLGNKLSRRRMDEPGDGQRTRSSASAAVSSSGSRSAPNETTGSKPTCTCRSETGAGMIPDNYRDKMRSATGGRRKDPLSHAAGTCIGGINTACSSFGGSTSINPRRRSNDRDRGIGTMRSGGAGASNGDGRGGGGGGGYRRRSPNEAHGHRQAPHPLKGGRRLSGEHGRGAGTDIGSVALGQDRTARSAHAPTPRRSSIGGDELAAYQQPNQKDGGTLLLRRSSAYSDAGGSDLRRPRYMKRRERGPQQQQQRSSSMDMLSNLDDGASDGHASSATNPDAANFHGSVPTLSFIGDFSEGRRASNEGATSHHYFSAGSIANASAASSAIKPGAVSVSGRAPNAQDLEAKRQAAAGLGRRSSADTTESDGFDELDGDNGGSSCPISEMRALKDTHITRTNELLFDVFPAHIARALRDGKKVEPEEREEVTIFFSDIVGYTDLVSRLLTPIQVSDLLDRLYSEFDDISEFHGVHKMETIGDAWMGVTNLVRPQDSDHCRRIAFFARDVISVANKTPIDEKDPSLGFVNLRVGFHSGPVVAPVVGRKNPRYCLFGDTVNVASRMESKSVKNRIQCSSASARLLKEQAPDIRLQCRGEVTVKGKGVMKTYWVLHAGENDVHVSTSDEEESRVTTDTPISRISVDTPISAMSPGASAKKSSPPPDEGTDGDLSEILKRLGLSEEDIAEQRRLWERLSTSKESKIASKPSGDVDAVANSQKKLGLSINEIDEQRQMWMQIENRKRNSERDLDNQLKHSSLTSGFTNNAKSHASAQSDKPTIPRSLSKGSLMALQAAMKEDGYDYNK